MAVGDWTYPEVLCWLSVADQTPTPYLKNCGDRGNGESISEMWHMMAKLSWFVIPNKTTISILCESIVLFIFLFIPQQSSQGRRTAGVKWTVVGGPKADGGPCKKKKIFRTFYHPLVVKSTMYIVHGAIAAP